MSLRAQIPLLLLLHFAGTTIGVAYASNALPSVETIVARMAQARDDNRARLHPYSVTREYRLFDEGKMSPRSEVIADVSFLPPHSKQFVIRKASGTRIGERIVRQMLEHESAIAKNFGSNEIAPPNYEFRFAGEGEWDGRECYVLEIEPRRKDKTLLRGRIWVDSHTYLLRRVEGEPAKPPSWWLRDARIALVYGEVDGMWLQTASESTADVRLLGRHTMQSRDIEYKTSEVVASGSGVPLAP